MDRTFRIVVGVDGSESGQRALAWAFAEAARRGHAGQPASVQAVTAWQHPYLAQPMSETVEVADPAEIARDVLAAAVAEANITQPDVSVAGEAVQGDAGDILVRIADDADLMVLGSHGHSRLYTAVLGSVAEACVRSATCPVVIIPVAQAASRPHTGASLATANGA